MRKKLLFVYNPRSGKQTIVKLLAYIVDIFTKQGYDVTCHPTQNQSDCKETIAENASSYDLIAVSGGDGTLNEAVNGFMQIGYSKPIGYIPCGSTNDFSHSIGIPIKPLHAANAIVTGKPFSCDLGSLNGRYFTYVAGFGTLTEVSYSTPQESKNIFGFSAYLLNGIAALPSITAFNISFESKERSGSGEYLLGLITNTMHIAGFKNIFSEDVLLNDGLFEVLLIKKPQNIKDFNNIASSLLSRSFDNECVEFFKTSRITITSEKPLSWTLDGENGGEHTSTVIEVHNNAISVMTERDNNALAAIEDIVS